VAATSLRRLNAALVLLATACALMLAAPGQAAFAAPGSEGGSKKLEDALESAAKGQADAIQRLNSSQRRQADLRKTVLAAQAGAKALEAQVGVIANRSYRLGRSSTATMLLDSSSPDVFLERVERLDMMAQVDGSTLQKYQDDVATAQQAKADIDREVAEQQKQVAALGKKKKEAQLALASIGGGAAGSGFLDPHSALAKPAPRNSDGSWPKEGCTVNDPTTDGCITPRLLNAYQNARAAGFTHYIACFRHQDSGEHPKGRACDFSAHASGFVNEAATGADKDYGNRLAAYFIKNADRLGVLYVIWYRQIWMPGTGWKAYSATGDAAAVHTNHVHLSVL
jgi:hypothetical protein